MGVNMLGELLYVYYYGLIYHYNKDTFFNYEPVPVISMVLLAWLKILIIS